jgi:hypothetical protein
MTDTYGDGFYDTRTETGSVTNTNGETGNLSSSGQFRDVVRESFDVVGRSTGSTVDYRLDGAYDDHPNETSWLLQSLTTGTTVSASVFNEVTEMVFVVAFCRLVSGGEHQLAPINSVSEGMCCGYGVQRRLRRV